MNTSARRLLGAVSAAAVVVASVLPATAQSLDDVGPVLAAKLDRGELVREPAPDRTPSVKTVDGDPSDWIGRSALVAGQWHLDAGELLHTDFLFDAFGADDGGDRQRLEDLGELFYLHQRTERIDDLLRTSGSQLGVPEPIGADDNYGDANRDQAVGDLVEVRFASAGDRIHLLTTFSNWTDDNRDRLAVLVLADTGSSLAGCAGEVALLTCEGGATWRPGGTPLRTDRFDTGVLLTADAAVAAAVRDGVVAAVPGSHFEVAADTSGWTNALEASLPADLLAPDGVLDVAILSGIVEDDGSFTPVNLASRPQEPIDIHNDRLQAFALLDAADEPAIDAFSSGPASLDDLRRGASERVRPGPGYHEILFRSGENISREEGLNGLWQHYGLAVPSAFAPGEPIPATFWLHYRGGKAHSAAAINPRLIRQHGEDRGHLVVSPRGRGTSTWYVTQAHQDVWEVFDDVHERFPEIDPRRRYLSGYSMGAYGTYLFGLLYPDVFAAGFTQSGAVTQGLWPGTGPDGFDPLADAWQEANDGDARAQLTYRILENARYFPIAIDHGTNDELVPVTGIERMALRLTELGYRHQYSRLLGYEHFTQAILDEWADGTAYLDRFVLPEQVRRVTYKVVPALIRALNTVRANDVEFAYNPDGAWWVSGIVARDANPDDPSTFALVDAISHAIVEEPTITLPVSGVASPPGHSTPYLRTGLNWIPDPLAGSQTPQDRFEVTLTDVAAVRLDLDEMQLTPRGDRPVTGLVTTDGPVTLTVAWEGGEQQFVLAAGVHEVTVAPAPGAGTSPPPALHPTTPVPMPTTGGGPPLAVAAGLMLATGVLGRRSGWR